MSKPQARNVTGRPATGPIDWEQEEERVAPRSLAAGDATGWFEELYAAGESGRVTMPWSCAEPHPLLVDWAESRRLAGAGRRAVVVGCGLGADGEYVASRGFHTTGFDISETAIRVARQRHPGSAVAYLAADLLDLPEQWLRAFDLVVEIITVQALPEPPRRQAIANISRLVAPAGTLFVVAAVDDDPLRSSDSMPPWPLSRDEIEAFAGDELTRANVEIVPMPGTTGERRWCAEFHRR